MLGCQPEDRWSETAVFAAYDQPVVRGDVSRKVDSGRLQHLVAQGLVGEGTFHLFDENFRRPATQLARGPGR